MPAASPAQLDRAALRVAQDLSWERGDSRFLLDSTQLKIRNAREAVWARRLQPATTQEEVLRRAQTPNGFFELASRETGKSFEALTLAQEVARTKPGARIVIIRGRRDDAEKVARDLMPMVEATCPEHLKLDWAPGDQEFKHKTNGSVIRFRGTEAEQRGRLRGFGYDLAIIDECAEIGELREVLTIVEPLVMRLNGYLVLATTPAEQPGHVSEEIYGELDRNGAAIIFTLLHNGRLSWEDKAKRLLSGTDPENVADVPDILAGKKNCKKTRNRREWFCEFVGEGTVMIHPRWADLEDELVVKLERAA